MKPLQDEKNPFFSLNSLPLLRIHVCFHILP